MSARTMKTMLMLGAALLLTPALGAATIVWSGAGDGTTWSQGTNWVGGVAPTAADEASFDGTSATAPTNVTGLTNTLQRITVNSGANPNLNLTLVLTGNVTLTGSSGASLFLGAGDAVTFQSGSATVRTLEIQADLDSSGGAGTGYTFADTVTLNTATSALSLVVRDQSSLIVQGLLAIDIDTDLQVNNTTATSVVNFNDIDLGGYLMPADTGGSPVVNIAGDIVYSADASAWDDGSVSGIFTVNLNGALVDFNNHENLEFDFDQSRVVVGGTLVLLDVATITNWSEPPRFDYLTVNAAASLTFPDGLPTSPSIFVNNDLVVNGTLNFGDNDFVTYGTVVTVGAGGSLQASVSPGTFVVQGNVLFTGTFTMPLDFYCWQDSLVALGSDVTFARTVIVNNCDFGADQDGATTTNMATLRFNGNFVVTAAGRLDVGEGNHYFDADIDLSAADDRVIGPSNSNTDPTVHLTGGAQAIDFSAGGSFLIVTSVAGTTSVTQSGLMILAGDLNLSGSTQATVWTSAAGSDIQVGDGNFGVQGTLTMGNADANFLGITIREVDNGSNFGEHSEYNFTRVTGGTGIVNMGWYLTIEGDTTDNSGTGGSTIEQESGGAVLNITNCEVVLDKTVVDPGTAGPIAVMVLDGESDSVVPPVPPPPAPADWEGSGAELNLDAAILRTPFIKVGVAAMTVGLAAPPVTEHMGAKFRAENGCTLDFNLSGVGNGLIAGHFAEVMLVDATLGGEGSYQVVTVPETNYTVMWNCDVDRGTSVGGTPSVKIYVGGLNVYLIGNTFNAMNSNGVWIRPNATVRAFNDNLFTNNTGQGGGTVSHISLQGLAVGSAAYWDNNYFDNSVNTGGGGLFVNVMSGSNPVQFRVPAGSPFGFGVVGFNVTAAQAETFDNDAAVVGTDVTWNDAANQLTITDESAGLPAGLVTDSGVTHQTVLLFGLSAAPGNVVVNGVTLEVDAYGTSLDEADVASFTLFEDANQNGAYDTGEEFAAATLNAAYGGGGTMTFDLAGAGVPQLIVAGTPQHWGVSVRFAASGNGYAGGLSVNLLPGGITTTDIVAGLPLLVDHIVTGPVSQLVIITQPGGAAATTPLSPQPVIELRDALGNRVLGDNSTVVTASIVTDPAGGSTLGGATGVPAVDGRVTFASLSINKAGVGFVLRFTAGAATVDSNPITITAAPSGGGGDGGDDGGCSTGGHGTPWLMLIGLLALGLLAVRVGGRVRRG
ncbi:MAG: hypothetical protein H6840_09325 [Planctomycetes bacterium]|nr:hypothetical protein [Planctomycetota bacterium]